MAVLLTGGAALIGSHVVRELTRADRVVVLLDELFTGIESRVKPARLERLNLSADSAIKGLRRILRSHRIMSVIHLAGKKRVDESIRRPAWYFHQSITGPPRLLAAMEAENVHKLVLSSSAAAYAGMGDVLPRREGQPAKVVAAVGRIETADGWTTKYALPDIIASAIPARLPGSER